jgi:hypothetical protein
MELKNIFKMEMYKNRNDKPYLLVIAILTIMAAVATFWGIAMIENNFDEFAILGFVPLVMFTILGLGVFSLLYPFHLLNVDYKNKVMSLIFASGVSREKYYFVKIGATIISCLVATFAVVFIPAVTFLIVYPDQFVELMRLMVKEFTVENIIPFVLSAVVGMISYIVMLTTAVIITKGKVSGIFLFFLFSFIFSSVSNMFIGPFDFNAYAGDYISTAFYISTIISVISICVFSLIGLFVLKKQDL